MTMASPSPPAAARAHGAPPPLAGASCAPPPGSVVAKAPARRRRTSRFSARTPPARAASTAAPTGLQERMLLELQSRGVAEQLRKSAEACLAAEELEPVEAVRSEVEEILDEAYAKDADIVDAQAAFKLVRERLENGRTFRRRRERLREVVLKEALVQKIVVPRVIDVRMELASSCGAAVGTANSCNDGNKPGHVNRIGPGIAQKHEESGLHKRGDENGAGDVASSVNGGAGGGVDRASIGPKAKGELQISQKHDTRPAGDATNAAVAAKGSISTGTTSARSGTVERTHLKAAVPRPLGPATTSMESKSGTMLRKIGATPKESLCSGDSYAKKKRSATTEQSGPSLDSFLKGIQKPALSKPASRGVPAAVPPVTVPGRSSKPSPRQSTGAQLDVMGPTKARGLATSSGLPPRATTVDTAVGTGGKSERGNGTGGGVDDQPSGHGGRKPPSGARDVLDERDGHGEQGERACEHDIVGGVSARSELPGGTPAFAPVDTSSDACAAITQQLHDEAPMREGAPSHSVSDREPIEQKKGVPSAMAMPNAPDVAYSPSRAEVEDRHLDRGGKVEPEPVPGPAASDEERGCLGDKGRDYQSRTTAKNSKPSRKRSIEQGLEVVDKSDHSRRLPSNPSVLKCQRSTESSSGKGEPLASKDTASSVVAGEKEWLGGEDRSDANQPDVSRDAHLVPHLSSKFPHSAPDGEEEIDTEGLDRVRAVIEEVKAMPEAAAFLQPVNSKSPGCETYYAEIQHPMDLGTISSSLSAHRVARRGRHSKKRYKQVDQVLADVELVWRNCFQFNNDGDEVCIDAEKCRTRFNSLAGNASRSAVGVEVSCGEKSLRKSRRTTRGIPPKHRVEDRDLIGSEPGRMKRKKDAGISEDKEKKRNKRRASTERVTPQDRPRRDLPVGPHLVGRSLAVFTLDVPGLRSLVKTGEEMIRYYKCLVESYNEKRDTYTLLWEVTKKRTTRMRIVDIANRQLELGTGSEEDLHFFRTL